jgi:hypothetical protein
MNKRSNTSKEIIIINLYAPFVGTPNFIKYTLLDLKSQKDPNTVKTSILLYHQ